MLCSNIIRKHVGHPQSGHTATCLFLMTSRGLALSLKSLYRHSSVCYNSNQIAGGVGGIGSAPPTSKLETFLSRPLALSKHIYGDFRIYGALGETLKPPDPRFLKQNRGLEVSKFLPKLHLFGNCYKSAYLEPRALTKTSPI